MALNTPSDLTLELLKTWGIISVDGTCDKCVYGWHHIILGTVFIYELEPAVGGAVAHIGFNFSPKKKKHTCFLCFHFTSSIQSGCKNGS